MTLGLLVRVSQEGWLSSFATSPLWILICLVAGLAILMDWRSAMNRRFVGALIVVLLLGGGAIFAAEVPAPDVCWACQSMSPSLWWLYLCFLC